MIPTPLPTHPTSLKKYLHQTQQSTLRSLYLSHLQGVPRPRRRNQHNRSPLPAAAPPLDRAHIGYPELLYSLSPALSADTYYYGPTPLPPPDVVGVLLRAVQGAHPNPLNSVDANESEGSTNDAFVDPEGVESAALNSWAGRVWELEREELVEVEGEEHADGEGGGVGEWEEDAIAAFGGVCEKKIGEGMGRLKREEEARVRERRDKARAAMAVGGPMGPRGGANAGVGPGAGAGGREGRRSRPTSPFGGEGKGGERERYIREQQGQGQGQEYWGR